MTSRRRAVLRNELRAVLVRAGFAGGALLGLLAGIDAAPGAVPDACPPTEAAAGCFTDTLVPGVIAVLGPVIGLALCGAMLGVLAGLPLRVRPAPALPPPTRTLTARHAGTCRSCGAGFASGSRVSWSRRHGVTRCPSCS